MTSDESKTVDAPDDASGASQPDEQAPVAGGGKGWRWVLAAALLVWLAVALPMAFGERTFFVRDVFSNHLPHKAFDAEQLKQGRIAAFDPGWGLGHVHRGNPSVLAFYPGNLLYLLLPLWSAFNLHFTLHWLLALVAMALLARTLGQSPPAALLAGITYAGSGWLLSALSFYNLLVVAAWWPLVIAGAVVGGRRGVCLGGAACGMALLGGEPITAALGLVPLLVAVVPRHGWKRALASSFAIGVIGLLVALPQIVATARIYGVSFRGGHGNIESQIASYYLILPRLAELVLPLPFGWPGYRGVLGVWHAGYAERLPFFMSIHFGIVALALALAARRRGWTLLAVASLSVAYLGGQYAELMNLLSAGLFRFPEKFLFWLALALPLLAGWGLERVLADGRRWRVLTLAASLGATLAAGLVWLLRPAFLERFAATLAGRSGAGFTLAQIGVQSALLALYLLLAGLLLVVSAWAVRRRRPAVVVGCQLAALLQLAPLVQTDSTAPYRERSQWEERVGPGAAVLATAMAQPPWHRPPSYPLAPPGSRAIAQRLLAEELHPTPGVLHGLTYPFAINLEGMSSALSTLLEINLKLLDWPQRVNWFRVMGLDYLAAQIERPDAPGLELVDEATRGGQQSWLFRVEDPAPEAWWPRSVRRAPNPREAVRWVSFADDPVADVAAAIAIEHRPGGAVRLLEHEPDRIVFESSSEGGLAVIRRAYQPLFVARAESGERLRTLPVNLLLLGVEVPAGEQRVTVAVRSWPEILAGLVALAALALALVLGFRNERSGARSA